MSDQQKKAAMEQELEREEQRKRRREEDTVRKVFAASTVRFKVAPEEVLQALGGHVSFDADGQALNGGKPLAERLLDYASINPQCVASSIAETHDLGKSTVRSREDLKTVRDKVDWIKANGGDIAYGRLPATAPQEEQRDPESLSFDEYKRLPISVKSALAITHPDLATRLTQRDREKERLDRLVGKPR